MKVELTCFLYNKKMVEDLGIETEDLPAKITLETGLIESIREMGKDGDLDVVCDKRCMVYMKSGQSFEVGNSYKEMLKIWEGFA